MDFEEYVRFLIDIRIASNKCKHKMPTFNFINATNKLIKEIDGYINTPSDKLQPPDWFRIGWVIGRYFGKEGSQMIYNKEYKWDKWQKK